MTDLDKLIAAVESGDEAALYAALRSIASAARDKGEYWPSYDAIKAVDGSLDAALRLHEALLPGWKWSRHHDGEIEVWTHGVLNSQWGRSAQPDPSRAWLLAILLAIKAKGEA